MSTKVALIFGYGPHVGADVASKFAGQGYRVAVVSRSKPAASIVEDYLTLEADLTDPSLVEGIFTSVIEKLGHPSVVVYNVSGMVSAFDRSAHPRDDISDLQADNNANIVSAYVTARLAVNSFDVLGQGSGTYIYTGNKLNFIVVPPLLSLGMGKAGAAHMINYLAVEYKDQGHKFYYADEREPDGTPVYSNIDGPAHAEFYTTLAEEKVQGPWLATFVKGKGYVDFQEVVRQVPGKLLPPKEQ